jgi:hypothetical protein
VVYRRSRSLKSGDWYIYDLTGKPITHNAFRDWRPPTEKILRVKKKNYWGCLNSSGKTIIDFKYNSISKFQNGRSIVKYIDTYGIIDKNGQFVAQPKYDRIEVLGNGLYAAKKGYITELLNSEGKVKYLSLGRLMPHACGVLEYSDEEKYGMLDQFGKVVVEPNYREVWYFDKIENVMWKGESGTGITDCSGNWIVEPEPEYQNLISSGDEFVMALIDGRYGFVDHNNKLRIANRYDGAKSYSDGLAAVKIGNSWGYIDKRERIRVQPHFDFADPFSKGRAIVSSDGKFGLINEDGEELIKMEYDTIFSFSDEGYIVRQNGEYGFVAFNISDFIPARYSSIEMLPGKYFKVGRKNKFGILDYSGRALVPLTQDNIVYDPYSGNMYVQEKFDWNDYQRSPN